MIRAGIALLKATAIWTGVTAESPSRMMDSAIEDALLVLLQKKFTEGISRKSRGRPTNIMMPSNSCLDLASKPVRVLIIDVLSLVKERFQWKSRVQNINKVRLPFKIPQELCISLHSHGSLSTVLSSKDHSTKFTPTRRITDLIESHPCFVFSSKTHHCPACCRSC